MLSKLKKIFSKSDKVEAFNESSAHRKYGVHIAHYNDNGKHMVYVNDIFKNDTVIALFDTEEDVNNFIDELTLEISSTATKRTDEMAEHLAKDLNKLAYFHKRDFKHLFISHYKKTILSVYLNKKIVKHVNDYIETKILGAEDAKEE